MGKGWTMTRRRFFQAFAAVMVAVCLLVLSGVLTAQGNSENAFQRVKEVQERHTEALMAREGVVGTAVGLDDDGNPAVLVLLEHGAIAGIPNDLEGVKVKKVVTGEIVARADPKAWFPRPVPIGVSTGNAGECSAGTIGCRVTDGSNVYALSNNHVYALENNAAIGSTVLQPGRYESYDGVNCPLNSANAIGTLWDFQPIERSGNTIDAAIARCEGTLGYSTPDDGGYGAPSSTPVTASLGLSVKKYGRTTLLSHGTVAYINATIRVQYYTLGMTRFSGQIGITPGDFSDSGDSGSLIVTETGNNPVGLLFAGGSTATFANPIGLVLERFGVTIDDGSGTPVPPPSTDVTVTRISPNSLKAGTSMNATITGTGFVSGAKVTFENGSGPVPSASSVNVVDGGTITATVKVKSGGPAGTRYWDVRVTNPDGSSGVLVREFTVTR